ncbi:MAG: AAA domain-containing protein [Phocaeicola sp.]
MNATTTNTDRLLSYWHTLEHFSPASVPNGCRKWVEKLPWEEVQKHSNPSKCFQYTFYFGVFPLNEVTEFVQEYFHSQEETPNLPTAKVCYASLKVDEQGLYIQDTFGLSTMPWALSQLKEHKLNMELPLDEFRKRERRIADHLVDGFLKEPLTREGVKQIQAYLLDELPWRELPSAAIYLRTEERERKQSKSDEEEEVTCDLLNSFYLEDLERIAKSLQTEKLPKAFQDYLTGCLGRADIGKRINLSDHPAVLQSCLTPEYYPDGCWPSPYCASLMQQFAINRVMDDLSGKKQEGLFSVNGPPGTGKTTLLRDIIAAILVQRAHHMIQFDEPAKAFTKLEETKKSEGYVPFIYEPHASICDGGIVVASSNNGAVENISKELPLKKEVKGYADRLGYFRTVSEGCVDPEHWGLIAAVMGSKKNQRKLIDAIWNKSPKARKQTLYQSLRDTQQAPTQAQWQETVTSFRNKLQAVRREKQRLMEGMKEAAQWTDLPRMVEEADRHVLDELQELEKLIQGKQTFLSETQAGNERQRMALEEARREQEQVLQSRPHWLSYWISREKRVSYQARLEAVASKIERLTQQVREHDELLQVHEQRLSVQRTKLKQVQGERERYAPLMEVCAELKGAYTDASFCHKINTREAQENSPWYSEELKKLESELFVEAMKVNECFLLMANQTSDRNISGRNLSGRIETTLDRFFKFLKSGEDLNEQQIRAMWNTFWLVIPVVSSTFASIQRMFGNLGPGSIPWLFIDEAGQAVPQAAAGALWRCKRAVVVGDPFQIEPVVTTPDAIIKELGNHFDLKWEQMDSTLSVQRMADRVNRYGWTMNDDWVGSPLRVHRRCTDPMFSIANEIAYAGMMYNSTPSASTKLLMETAFVDVRGNVEAGCRHYVTAQGEVIRKMILDEIDRQQALPDLFVISPFSEIPSKLRSELEKPLKAAVANLPQQMNDKKVNDWLDTHIGTVHTFQGKQAEGVILCLGLDSTKERAAQWAASKPNLLNVALTRAKLRFVAVGDGQIWLGKPYFRELESLKQVQAGCDTDPKRV